MDKKLFWREFWILWGLGVIAGVTGALITTLPVTPLANHLFLKGYDLSRHSLVSLEIAEIVFELAITVGVGLLAAHAVGLGAPLLEAWLRGGPSYPSLSSLLAPTLIVGIAVGALVETQNLPVFHQDREASIRLAETFADSPAHAKTIERLARFVGPRLTPATTILLDVAGAISAASDRLFWISGFAWIFVKIRRARLGSPSRGILWAAICAAAAVGAVFYFATLSANAAAITSYAGELPVSPDPWLVVKARGLLNTLPWSIGLGWLYTRKGLECTVAASLVARATEHLLLLYVIVRFFR
jgi:hypothetical protein